jgi:hypothetical protein
MPSLSERRHHLLEQILQRRKNAGNIRQQLCSHIC